METTASVMIKKKKNRKLKCSKLGVLCSQKMRFDSHDMAIFHLIWTIRIKSQHLNENGNILSNNVRNWHSLCVRVVWFTPQHLRKSPLGSTEAKTNPETFLTTNQTRNLYKLQQKQLNETNQFQWFCIWCFWWLVHSVLYSFHLFLFH